MSEWQPISTAPKDLTVILVWDMSGRTGEIELAYWERDRWSNYEGFTIEPTHWMPLPEPPK